jgi:hypothetical protein
MRYRSTAYPLWVKKAVLFIGNRSSCLQTAPTAESEKRNIIGEQAVT